MKFVTRSPEETIAVGRKIARLIEAPRVVLLQGDLGAGKTTLAKGIISGLGAAAPEDVSSPTFALIHEYGDRPKVRHIDLYRLDSIPELETLGLDDFLDERAITLIEWGEKFAERLPADPLVVQLSNVGEYQREISITGDSCGASHLGK